MLLSQYSLNEKGDIMLKNTYLSNLINQYVNATGVKDIGDYDKNLIKDVFSWLEQRKFLAQDYLLFLDELNIRYKDSDCVEVEKGKFDSITFEKFENGILTPYFDGLHTHKGEILNNDLEISSGIPGLLSFDGNTKCLDYMNLYKYNSYMIHNPYEMDSLKNWDMMHNKGLNGIVVGCFGNSHDKYFWDKIKQIGEFQEKLQGDYISELSLKNSNYCYVLASKKALKK